MKNKTLRFGQDSIKHSKISRVLPLSHNSSSPLASHTLNKKFLETQTLSISSANQPLLNQKDVQGCRRTSNVV